MTELGDKLRAIRGRAIAKGMAFLSEDEILDEVKKRREGQMDDEELVRRVAVEVMGWDYDGASWHEKGILLWRFNDWNPLTNANHWMQVVEQMVEIGWIFSASCKIDNDGLLQFAASFRNPKTEELHTQHGEPFGHAVCLAALKAVEEAT